jgi:hypothetical protein
MDDADIFISIEKFSLLEVQVNLNTTGGWPGNKVIEISDPTTYHQKQKEETQTSKTQNKLRSRLNNTDSMLVIISGNMYGGVLIHSACREYYWTQFSQAVQYMGLDCTTDLLAMKSTYSVNLHKLLLVPKTGHLPQFQNHNIGTC